MKKKYLNPRVLGILVSASLILPGAAQGASIMGYYPNWARYQGGNYFTPNMIPSGLNEVIYAFGQFGHCAMAQGDPKHPDGYATEVDPTFCNPNPDQCQSGQQDFTMASTDIYSDLNQTSSQIYPKAPNGQYCGSWQNGGMKDTLNRAKAIGAKAVISIGGWSLSAPIRLAIQPANEAKAIQSIVSFLKVSQAGASKNWDGIDIDWEPNGNQWTLPNAGQLNLSVTKNDLQNYLQFLTDLKVALCAEVKKGSFDGCEVKIAMTANTQAIAAADQTYGGKYWLAVSNAIDALNMMTYDYKGPFGQQSGNCSGNYQYPNNCTGFNAPLLSDPDPKAYNNSWSVDGSYKALISSNVPPSKIGIGIANYGRSFALPNLPTAPSPYIAFQSPAGYSNGACTKPNATPFDGPNGEITNRTLITGTSQINQAGTDGAGVVHPKGPPTGYNFSLGEKYYDAAAGYFSLVNGPSGAPACLVTYDLAHTAAEKMKYAVSNGLYGVIVWDVTQDVRADDIDQATGQKVDMLTQSTLTGLNNYQFVLNRAIPAKNRVIKRRMH